MAITSGTASATLSSRDYLARARNSTLNPVEVEDSFSTTLAFTSIGAGTAAFNQEFCDIRTLAAGASETLDLTDGTLLNPLGEAIGGADAFARIKFFSVELLPVTASASITVGDAASDPWVGPWGGTNPTETIRNGGFYANGCSDATGYVVTAGSADRIKITNNSGSAIATYRIRILGAKS